MYLLNCKTDLYFSQIYQDSCLNLTLWLSLLMDRPCHNGNECLQLRALVGKLQ